MNLEIKDLKSIMHLFLHHMERLSIEQFVNCIIRFDYMLYEVESIYLEDIKFIEKKLNLELEYFDLVKKD